MGSGKSGKAKIPTAKADSGGLYGSVTANKKGTTFKPTDFQTGIVNQTESAIPDYLSQLINPSYDSEIFKAQTDQRNRLASKSFENNLINPLASRGLTRGSSVNAMSNAFNNNLINAEVDAMASEDARVNGILQALMNYRMQPYNEMQGLASNALQQQGMLANAQAQANANKSNMMGMLAGGLGTVAGAYFGGPAGATVGGQVGSQLGQSAQ